MESRLLIANALIAIAAILVLLVPTILIGRKWLSDRRRRRNRVHGDNRPYFSNAAVPRRMSETGTVNSRRMSVDDDRITPSAHANAAIAPRTDSAAQSDPPAASEHTTDEAVPVSNTRPTLDGGGNRRSIAD